MQSVRPNLAAVAAKVIDGEAIIMNLTNGAYYSMLGSGAVVWSLIEQGTAIERIPDALAQVFEVEPSRARPEVERLIAELLAEDLVVSAEAAPATDRPATAARLPWTAPALNKYTEMADLLALDPPMPAIGLVPNGNGSAG